MNLIKKIAKYILRKELLQMERFYDTMAEERVRKIRKQLDASESERKFLFKQKLERHSREVLLSRSLLSAVEDCLPNPNYMNQLDVNHVVSSYRKQYKLFGQNVVTRLAKINMNDSRTEIKSVVVEIKPMNISVEVFLKFREFGYTLFGVSSSISTYYWDLSETPIKVIEDRDMEIIVHYLLAQNNAIVELKSDGLL